MQISPSILAVWERILGMRATAKLSSMTCDFQRCGILTSVDSDEPVQPPFKLRNSKYCSVSSFSVIEYSSDLHRL